MTKKEEYHYLVSLTREQMPEWAYDAVDQRVFELEDAVWNI